MARSIFSGLTGLWWKTQQGKLRLYAGNSKISGGSMLLNTRHHHLDEMLKLFDHADNWLIAINADPDAIASAMALKRIMARRTGEVAIAKINNITRPDNLAMIRNLHISLMSWPEAMARKFKRYAMVDSQPHHNPAFAGLPFSIIIDHHPLSAAHKTDADYMDIRPGMATTSAILTSYLRVLKIRPGMRLATALQYGIRTDTASFSRNATKMDLSAYRELSPNADSAMLTRIIRSEYLPEWLKFFSRAFSSLHLSNDGGFAFAGEVESPDILVVIADFFSRVHGLSWIAVSGIYDQTAVVIFRGDGHSVDLGAFASDRFSDIGCAGGHKEMARAEFPLSAATGHSIDALIFRRLFDKKPPAPRKRK
jgi:nanoRNase/pAp phosphatase (c-di-AMP/oligoRNAs hydrolase)